MTLKSPGRLSREVIRQSAAGSSHDAQAVWWSQGPMCSLISDRPSVRFRRHQPGFDNSRSFLSPSLNPWACIFPARSPSIPHVLRSRPLQYTCPLRLIPQSLQSSLPPRKWRMRPSNSTLRTEMGLAILGSMSASHPTVRYQTGRSRSWILPIQETGNFLCHRCPATFTAGASA